MRLNEYNDKLRQPDIYVKAYVISEPVIDEMRPGDWEEVKAIYAEGIETRQATFEVEAPSWEAWDAAHLPCARLVARQQETVAGWASPLSGFPAASIRRRCRSECLCRSEPKRDGCRAAIA